MAISREPAASSLISRSDYLSCLPPWRRWLATLNWHPTLDAQIRELESKRRISELESEIARLHESNSKLDALLRSSDSSSQPAPAE